MECDENKNTHTHKGTANLASCIARHAGIELTSHQLERYCHTRHSDSPEHTRLSDHRLLFNLLRHKQQVQMCEAYPHMDLFETYPHNRILGPALENLDKIDVSEMSLTELMAVKDTLCPNPITDEVELNPVVAHIDRHIRLRLDELGKSVAQCRVIAKHALTTLSELPPQGDFRPIKDCESLSA